MKSQKKFPPIYSFEFFPPKTPAGIDKLRATRTRLATLEARFFSVTFGAGGTTRDRTFETVIEIQQAGLQAAPHLSCIGSTQEEINAILHRYREHNVNRLVALRGDIPSGMVEIGEFQYAYELVAFIRAQSDNYFHIEVAAYPEVHPQAKSPQQDLDNFKRKVDAGADSAITQYFYNADSYFHFIEQCEKKSINIPIVPGIMPITNYHQLARFSDACGAQIPRWIRLRLQAYEDDLESLRAFGTDVVTQMCQRLLDEGAPGLHFYTMNQAEATLAIWQGLNFKPARS